MSGPGRHFGSLRPRLPLALSAVLLLGAIGLFVTGDSVARTSAADNEAPRPGGSAGPRVEVITDAARKFISDYCTRCHNDVRKVAYDPADAGNFAL